VSRSSSMGGRVETERKRLGITQSDLAAKIGVTQGTVSRWESNQATPDPKTARLLREAGFKL
jgi:transcriptional regulator with XRE-family HTH domain